MVLKAVSVQWGTEQEKIRQQVQSALQLALPLWPYFTAGPMVLKVSEAERNAVFILWQALTC